MRMPYKEKIPFYSFKAPPDFRTRYQLNPNCGIMFVAPVGAGCVPPGMIGASELEKRKIDKRDRINFDRLPEFRLQVTELWADSRTPRVEQYVVTSTLKGQYELQIRKDTPYL